MKPIKFEGCNVTYGEGQPEYQPLPAIRTNSNQVITCWEFEEHELEQVNKDKRVYLCQLIDPRRPFPPMLPATQLDELVHLVQSEPIGFAPVRVYFGLNKEVKLDSTWVVEFLGKTYYPKKLIILAPMGTEINISHPVGSLVGETQGLSWKDDETMIIH